MTLSYSSGLLNRNLAPGISEFTSCNASDITAYHPDASHWLTNHFLNSAFRGTFKNKHRQYAMNLIFRAQVSFADYHEARGFTAEYLVKGNPHNPATRAYFRAIARWESCLLSRPCKIRFSKSTLHGVTKNQFFDDHVSDPIARSRSPYAPSRII